MLFGLTNFEYTNIENTDVRLTDISYLPFFQYQQRRQF